MTTVAVFQANELHGVDCSGLHHDTNRIFNTYPNGPIHTTITKSEHLALENLRKDKDHIIVTADKGVVLVVVDKTEYITKCEALLHDNSSLPASLQRHISNYPQRTHEILQDYKNNNIISETECTKLRPHDSNSPAAKFYGLPKFHKYMPVHSIVSSCGAATYNTAKFITKILQNYCGKTSSFVKDSTDFIHKIKHLSINPEEESLVSFDVSALFISIPVPVAQQVINSRFLPAPISPMSAWSLQNIHQFTITNGIFCFNRKFYTQLQGAAMGSPVSPVIANIYMEYFESLAIPRSPTLIKWWFRYVDDVHSATRKDQVNKLQKHLNSIDPHIKFTIELPGTDGLPFLDTPTKPTPNSIESTVYRKTTHTNRHLHYKSNHHFSKTICFPHPHPQRAKQVCSTP